MRAAFAVVGNISLHRSPGLVSLTELQECHRPRPGNGLTSAFTRQRRHQADCLPLVTCSIAIPPSNKGSKEPSEYDPLLTEPEAFTSSRDALVPMDSLEDIPAIVPAGAKRQEIAELPSRVCTPCH